MDPTDGVATFAIFAWLLQHIVIRKIKIWLTANFASLSVRALFWSKFLLKVATLPLPRINPLTIDSDFQAIEAKQSKAKEELECCICLTVPEVQFDSF